MNFYIKCGIWKVTFVAPNISALRLDLFSLSLTQRYPTSYVERQLHSSSWKSMWGEMPCLSINTEPTPDTFCLFVLFVAEYINLTRHTYHRFAHLFADHPPTISPSSVYTPLQVDNQTFISSVNQQWLYCKAVCSIHTNTGCMVYWLYFLYLLRNSSTSIELCLAFFSQMQFSQ